MGKMKIKPEVVATEIFNKTTELERKKIKNNLPNFGRSIFVKFNFNAEEEQAFKNHLKFLIDGEKYE